MKIIGKPENGNEPKSIGPYLFKLIIYWPLFLLLIISALALGWIYIQVTAPLYKTTARVLVRDTKNEPQDSKSFQSLDVISPKKSVDNEMEVFQSTDLISKVVTDQNLYAPVYIQNTFRDNLAYNSSPIIVTSNDLSTLKKTKKVFFTFNESIVTINKVSYNLNKLYQTPYGNLKFIKNVHQTDNDFDGKFYFSILSPKKVVDDISANFAATISNKLSSIIDLELKDEDPDRGEAILNDLINSYNVSVDEEKNQLAANTEKFIDERLKNVENTLLDNEHAQQSVKANKGAIDISTQGKLYLENVSSNDQKVSEINTQLSVLNQIERYVKSKNLASGIVPSTVGVNDPGLTQMVKNVYELQLEVESLKKTTGENNPIIVSYTDQIEKIRPQILENIENQKQSLKASSTDLSHTNESYSSQLQSMPETEKKLVDINREISINSDVYTFLLQKKEETALSFISNGTNSKVINKPAASDSPVSPKKKFIYLGALLIGIIFSLGIVSVKESLGRNIMYQTDIESLTSLPVISEITAGNSDTAIVIGDNQRTLIAEQFRRLRTTLSYLGIGGQKKRILITSAISGEGKSFVAINLAMSLALTGKKVALLDFDLSNPTLHTKLKLKKGEGITDYLIKDISPESILNNSKVDENLFFISAGNIANNPSELITNGKPEELLDALDDFFDFVIIDAPPVGPVSDAYVLSPLCDATLYIVRHAYTPKIFVEKIDKNNLLNKLNNAAIVFNDVSTKNFSNYGYGYGHGYVYENKSDKNRPGITDI